jgi:hypothetical protein
MSLTIENETHWKKSDIERIVRDALKEADGDPSETRNVTVKYQRLGEGSRVSYVFYGLQERGEKRGSLLILLPKRGPRNMHSNAMVALAASRAADLAGLDKDTTILAVSDSYFLANALAFEFAKEAFFLYEDGDGKLARKRRDLSDRRRSIQCPSWGNPERLFITKYKDPKKDGTYLAKVKKKKTAIKRAETEIIKYEGELAAVKRKLKGAKARKKAAEKSLKDMAARRS